MPKRTVGIEIGTENIKIVYGVKKKGDFSLLDYRIIKSSDKVFGLDEELNINEIYPILVSSLEDMNVKKADCYITISSKKTIIRTRDLPIVKKKEMGNIIKFEAEQFLPYSIEAFAVDYKVVGSYVDDEGASFAKVMIVAVPLEIVQDYMALVNLTKLNLRGMTVYTDALFSYFTNNRNNKDRNILIADIGHNFSRMLMIENNEYFANINNEKGYNEVYRKLLESGKLNKNKIEELLSWKNDENPAEQPPETVDKIVTDENTVETKAINAEANGVDKKLTGLADRMKAIKEDNALMQKSEVEDEPEDKLSALRDRISAVKSNGNNVGLSNEEDESIQDDDKPNVDKILERIMKTQSESVIETPEEEAQVRTDLALTSAYNEVSREIMRMVDFFRTRKFDTHVTEIVLLGGGSNMNGFREHMENTADINTNLIGNIEENIEIDVVDYQLLVPSIGAILGG